MVFDKTEQTERESMAIISWWGGGGYLGLCQKQTYALGVRLHEACHSTCILLLFFYSDCFNCPHL